MIGLHYHTCSNASQKLFPYSFIRYAITQDVDLEIPAIQWTRIFPSDCLASWMNLIAFSKYWAMLAEGMSSMLKTRYLKSLGNQGGKPYAAVSTWVMPLDLSENLLFAAIALPK